VVLEILAYARQMLDDIDTERTQGAGIADP